MSPRSVSGALAAFLALMTSAGCDGTTRAGEVTVRDSAGIEIRVYPVGFDVPLWTVADSPSVRIGVVEGDPRYQFNRIVGAIRTREERILVLDQRSRRVSAYSLDGEFLAETGREGEGPGEYQNPIALWELPSDSLAVYDTSMGLTILSRDFGSTRRVPLRPLAGRAAGVFDDGALLVINSNPDVNSLALADYWRASTSGLDSIGRFRHMENIKPGSMMELQNQTTPLITRFRHVAAGGQAIFMAPNERHEIEIRDAAGSLLRITRWSGPDLTLTADDVESFKQSLLGDGPAEERAQVRRTLDEQSVPDTRPAFQWVFVDRTDRAWLEEWRLPSQTGPHEWTVVGAEGELLARVRLPEDADPLDIGRDFVLVRETDELGVQSVALYSLDQRPAG